MTANQHPYPEHVVEAVAEALWNVSEGSVILSWNELGDNQTRAYQYTKANTALNALWDAIRVDEIRQVDDLMPNALLRTTDGYMWAGAVANKQDVDLLPAHVLHWGNYD